MLKNMQINKYVKYVTYAIKYAIQYAINMQINMLQNMQNMLQNMQKYFISIEYGMCSRKYAKYTIKYAKYAKYAILQKICTICTPQFADASKLPARTVRLLSASWPCHLVTVTAVLARAL